MATAADTNLANDLAMRRSRYSGIYLLIYERVRAAAAKSRVMSPNGDGSLTPLANFAVGASCAALATTLTHPPDVVRAMEHASMPLRLVLRWKLTPLVLANLQVRTRLQLELGSAASAADALRCAKQMVASEGVRSLFLGLTPRLAKRALQMGLTWMVVEEAMRRAGSSWSFR